MSTHLLQIMGTRVRISSMRPLSRSLRIFSALLRNSREELYFGGSSGNFGFLTFFVVISDLEDILKYIFSFHANLIPRKAKQKQRSSFDFMII